MRWKAVAWDVDGTLIESEDLHHRALVNTCAAHGLDLSALPNRAFQGVHMLDVWSLLRERLARDLDRHAWLAAIDRFYIENAGELVASPQARETIRALNARGVAQACVSNSSRLVVDANLAALGVGGLIAFSVSLDDVGAGKPDPSRTACRRWSGWACPALRRWRSRIARRARLRRRRRGCSSSDMTPSGARRPRRLLGPRPRRDFGANRTQLGQGQLGDRIEEKQALGVERDADRRARAQSPSRLHICLQTARDIGDVAFCEVLDETRRFGAGREIDGCENARAEIFLEKQ